MNASCERFRLLLEERLLGRDAGELGWHEHLSGCAACRALFAGEEALDELLASLPAPALPPAFATRVLGALRQARGDERLDRVLERMPAPAVPARLSERVLRGLSSERVVPLRPVARRGTPRSAWIAPLALAAAVLVVALGVRRWRGGADPAGAPGATLEEPGAELFAALDVLENWELVTSDDLDVLLAGLDPVDEALLQLDDDVEEEG